MKLENTASINTQRYLDLDCVSLENGTLKLLVTQSVGPRIISLQSGQGENLFAELPDQTLDYPGEGAFILYGGHRLWHAPEVASRTYLPDSLPVEITQDEQGLLVTQPVEQHSGIQKSMHISLPDERPRVVVRHTLANKSLWPVTCSVWALTQFKTGGFTILPQSREDTGLQPNRSLTFWPYSDIGSPNITWGNDYIFVRADFKSGAFKIGYANSSGWLAYWRAGTLFIKQAAFDAGADYYDHGSSSECYCNDHFLELESLGPITTIQPEESVGLLETWQVFDKVQLAAKEDVVAAFMKKVDLEA